MPKGCLFSLSGIPDFLFVADEPIRSEMLIEACKPTPFSPTQTGLPVYPPP